jgi:hypothetical protein
MSRKPLELLAEPLELLAENEKYNSLYYIELNRKKSNAIIYCLCSIRYIDNKTPSLPTASGAYCDMGRKKKPAPYPLTFA